MGKKWVNKNKSEVTINSIIDLHVYPFSIMLSVGQTHEQLCQSIQKLYDLSDAENELLKLPPTAPGRCVMLDGHLTVIILKNLPNNSSNFGTVSHEVFHATAFIMHTIGVELQVLKSDEAYAYLIGYITKKVYEIITPFYK